MQKNFGNFKRILLYMKLEKEENNKKKINYRMLKINIYFETILVFLIFILINISSKIGY